MVSFKSRRAIDRNQLKALGILVLLVLGGVVLLSYPNGSLFQPFLGGIHPFVAIGLSCILGFSMLSFLLSKRWFTIYREHALKSMLPYVIYYSSHTNRYKCDVPRGHEYPVSRVTLVLSRYSFFGGNHISCFTPHFTIHFGYFCF